MISFFRKNKRGIVGTLIVGMCVVLMLPFGLDYFGNGSSLSKSFVAKVGDVEISALTYDRSFYQFQSMLKKQFGENYEKISSVINIKQKVLDDLINKKILEGVFSKSGFEIGLSHVEAYIKSLPVFSGEVTREKLVSFLKYQGISEQQFRAEIENALKFDQLEKILALASSYSPTELENRYLKTNQKLILSYAKVDLEKEDKEVQADEISSYFDKNKDNFKTEKSFSLKVLKLPFSFFENKVAIQEEDYQDAYQRHKREFVIPEQARLEILSFEKKMPDFLENNATPKIDYEKLAISTKEQIDKDVAKFEELGRANGASYRIDDAMHTVSSLPKEIQNKLKELKINEVSGVIETPGDYSLVKILEYSPESMKPLDSVKQELEVLIRKDMSPEFALVKAEQIKSHLESLDKLKIQDELNSIKNTESLELINLEGDLSKLPPEVSELVINKSEGEVFISQSNDGLSIVFLSSIKNPEQKQLSEVSGKIKKEIQLAKKREGNLKIAKEILVSSKHVGDFVAYQGFKELLKKHKLETTDIEGSLNNLRIPFLVQDATTSALISEIIMNGTHLNPVEAMDGNVYVFVLKEISISDTKPTQEAKKTFLMEEEKRTVQKLEKVFTDYLKSKKEIVVNDKVLDMF